MSRLPVLSALILLALVSTPALAQMDIDCLVEAHSRYVEAHNHVFDEASRQLAEVSPEKHALLTDFVEYQTRSNALKAYVVAYVAARAPDLLNTGGGIARIVPQHGTGRIHQLMMRDPTYRDYYPDWRRQSQRFIHGEGFGDEQWRRFVAARSELNRVMGSQKGYSEVLKAYSWPVAEICRLR